MITRPPNFEQGGWLKYFEYFECFKYLNILNILNVSNLILDLNIWVFICCVIKASHYEQSSFDQHFGANLKTMFFAKFGTKFVVFFSFLARKFRFLPAFWVRSTQMLVKIYNKCSFFCGSLLIGYMQWFGRKRAWQINISTEECTRWNLG